MIRWRFIRPCAGVPHVSKSVSSSLDLLRCATVSVLLTGLVACSSAPKTEADTAKALPTTTEPLAEFMSRAQAAEALEGGRERGRLIYRDAAKAYPTDKRPWLRLAQSYFDAADYGNAVLAAQEVVQRDPADGVAQGLLAVSGLRISTTALSALRNQNSLNTSTRSEAEDMARNLRSILGEAVLVPKPEDAASAAVKAQPPKAVRRPVVRRGAPAAAAAAPAAPAATPAPAPAPPAKAAPSNPFGAFQ